MRCSSVPWKSTCMGPCSMLLRQRHQIRAMACEHCVSYVPGSCITDTSWQQWTDIVGAHNGIRAPTGGLIGRLDLWFPLALERWARRDSSWRLGLRMSLVRYHQVGSIYTPAKKDPVTTAAAPAPVLEGNLANIVAKRMLGLAHQAWPAWQYVSW